MGKGATSPSLGNFPSIPAACGRRHRDRDVLTAHRLFSSYANRPSRAWIGIEFTVYNVRSVLDLRRRYLRRRYCGKGCLSWIRNHAALGFDSHSAFCGDSVRSLYRRVFRHHSRRWILPYSRKEGTGVWRSFGIDNIGDNGNIGRCFDNTDRS